MKVGDVFGGFELLELIGSGSTGQVWRARRGTSAQQVALKVLWEQLAQDSSAREAFVEEATLLADHDLPNVVQIRGVVRESGWPALVMDLVEGTDLRSLLVAEAPLQPARALAIAGHVAQALSAAHAGGLVHRDLKPENVLVTHRDGEQRAVVTDFGLAAKVETSTVRRTSRLVGTVDYLSPEVIQGMRGTAAADVYALGVVLYEALAGWRPFRGPGMSAIMNQHQHGVLVRPQGLPDPVWNLLRRMLDRAPDARPTSTALASSLVAMSGHLQQAPALLRTEPPEPLLEGAGQLPTEVVLPPPPESPAEPGRTVWGWPAAAGAAVLLFLALALALGRPLDRGPRRRGRAGRR